MSSLIPKHSGLLPVECTELSIKGLTVYWYHFPEVTSTMDIAAAHARNGGRPWSVISADTQTNGRGTHGRDWYSPSRKGFWISILLPLPKHIESASTYTLHAAHALADTVQILTGLTCSIKHPNDVMAGGRKLAGILIESVSSGDVPVSLVLGMGVNIGQADTEFSRAGLPDATSLSMESGSIPDREQLLSTFVALFYYRIADNCSSDSMIQEPKSEPC